MRKYLLLVLPAMLLASLTPIACFAQDDEAPPAPSMSSADESRMDSEYHIIKKYEARNDSLVRKLIVAKYKAGTLVLERQVKELDEKDSSITLWLKHDSSFVLQCRDKTESGRWRLFLLDSWYYLELTDSQQLSSLYPVLIRYDYDFEKGIPRTVKSLLLPLDLPCEPESTSAFFARVEK